MATQNINRPLVRRVARNGPVSNLRQHVAQAFHLFLTERTRFNMPGYRLRDFRTFMAQKLVVVLPGLVTQALAACPFCHSDPSFGRQPPVELSQALRQIPADGPLGNAHSRRNLKDTTAVAIPQQ